MGHSYDNGWDTKPKLDEARVIAPEAPTHRARKDRRRWCKGKVGVEHVPAIQESKNSRYMLERHGPDNPHTRCEWKCKHHWRAFMQGKRWVASGEAFWSCQHERACANCGKILQYFGIGRDCPDWTPQPAELTCDCWSCTKRYAP